VSIVESPGPYGATASMAYAAKAAQPAPAEKPIPPRLFRVRFTTGEPRRRVAFVKCPYGGVHDLYALSAALSRALTTRQIRRFSIDTNFEITPLVRAEVERWPQALHHAAPEVNWE